MAEQVKMLRKHWGFRKNSVENSPLGEENPSWLIAYKLSR